MESFFTRPALHGILAAIGLLGNSPALLAQGLDDVAQGLHETLALAAPGSPVDVPTAPETSEPTAEPSLPWWRSWWPW